MKSVGDRRWFLDIKMDLWINSNLMLAFRRCSLKIHASMVCILSTICDQIYTSIIIGRKYLWFSGEQTSQVPFSYLCVVHKVSLVPGEAIVKYVRLASFCSAVYLHNTTCPLTKECIGATRRVELNRRHDNSGWPCEISIFFCTHNLNRFQ